LIEQHPAKAYRPMHFSVEPAQNVTVTREQQLAKQELPRNVTDDGIAISATFAQAQNAANPIETR
jgi:hypothetical protein